MLINDKQIDNLDSLSEALGTNVKSLIYFANNVTKYVHEYPKPKKNGSGEKRMITAPSKPLKSLQRDIKDCLLVNYEYPSYVFGLGGNNLKDNVTPHTGRVATIKIDLKDFYPSIGYLPVYKMWREKFGFDHESARVLAKLTTMNNQLKQGFPTSSHIAAIVAEDFTGALNDYSKEQGYGFSQYVDDLNTSGENIDYKAFFKLVVPLSRKFGFHVKVQKTKVTSKLDGKVITGVSVYDQRIRASKDIRHKAIRAFKYYAANPNDESAFNRVCGYLGFLKHVNVKDGKSYKELIEKIKKQ